MIPKKIFQTHEWEYEDLPDFMSAITQTWIKMNPTWEYIYVSGKNRRAYVNEHHPDLIQMYDILPGMFQCDIWRYIVLYNNGGVYADMDSICIKNLDKMLDEKYTDQEVICSIPKNKDKNCVNNANFMSTKMSKVLKECVDTLYLKSENIKNKIEELEKNVYSKDDFYLKIYPAALHKIYRTEWKRPLGPRMFHNAVMNNKEKVLFEIDDVSFHSEKLKEVESAFKIINDNLSGYSKNHS
jgi:mannosyltransferase OCH1-like enzyme